MSTACARGVGPASCLPMTPRALLTLTLLATHAFGAKLEPASPEPAVKNRWMVLLRSDVSPDQVAPLAADLARGNGKLLTVWTHALRGFLIEIPDDRAPVLAESPWVERVTQDHRILNAFSTPIDDCSAGTALSGPLPSLPETINCADPDPQNLSATCTDNWGLDRLDGATTSRDGIYNPPRTGQGVNIFLLDTGLYAQHQDFTGRVGQGFDATSTGGTDDCGAWSHGSHVAGIAAGTRFGVAKGATLHSIRVATCPLNLQVSYLVAGFDWIAQVHGSTIPGPAVASMSINSTATDFSDPTSVLNTAITGTLNAGVQVIESAGNNLGDACMHVSRAPGVLIVGGSDEFDTPWERAPADPNYAGWCTSGGDCGSNTGACVSLFAPAAHIVSSWYGMTVDPRNMCRLSGTSMAAPHAAGVAALYLQLHPTSTPAQLRQGLIDQARAVLTALPAGSPNKLLSVLEGPAGVAGVMVNPPSVDFGARGAWSASPPSSVVVTSTGTLPLHVGTVLTGAHAGDFAVSGCAQPIAPTATCTLQLVFTPSVAGARTASLVLTTDDPARATITISLQGSGDDPRLTLVLAGDGAGRVESSPSGIACGASCAANFPWGTALTLSAVPSPGSVFSGWGDAGTCAAASCGFALTDSVTLTANFSRTIIDAGIADAGAPDAGPMITRDGGVVHVDAVAGGCGCVTADVSLILLALLLSGSTARASLVGRRGRDKG